VKKVKKTILHVLWKRHEPGTWVVLNPEMTAVLGAGKTPQVAMRKAGLPTGMVSAKEAKPYKKRPVMMQVIDPSMRFY
jgi:hypothetical protein